MKKKQAEPASPCTSCVWAHKQEGKVLCPFARCVEEQGWSAGGTGR